MDNLQAKVMEHLRKPYARVVTPEDDGTFRAEILEFSGCLATGDTAAKALEALERVAESWLEFVLEKGQRVPDPIETAEYSGKLMLRLPKSLHKKAAHAADRDGVSLNQFIVSSVALEVGERVAPQQVAQPQSVVFVAVANAGAQWIATGFNSAATTAGILTPLTVPIGALRHA
ncbi:MAG: toxin-antitoxin system HicB family antitoxin [Alphaproteobacteria bacterium]